MEQQANITSSHCGIGCIVVCRLSRLQQPRQRSRRRVHVDEIRIFQQLPLSLKYLDFCPIQGAFRSYFMSPGRF